MDNGDGQDENTKASTSASTNKRVSFMSEIKVVNADEGSGNGRDSDITLKEIDHGSDRVSNSSDSADSPSSESSNEEANVHVDPQELPPVEVQTDAPKSDSENDNVDIVNELSFLVEEPIVEDPESRSRGSDITISHEPILPSISPMLSPPIQVMERDPESPLDSVLSRPSTPSTAMGWSATSNDSLFSIRLGATSFSRNPAHRMDHDLSKSGRIPKSEDLFISGELYELRNSQELPKTGELGHSAESYKGSDITFGAELVCFSQASSSFKAPDPIDPEETGMEYLPLNGNSEAQIDTSSKKSSAASSPTARPVKTGTNSQEKVVMPAMRTV
ncbi:uncharacterized protein LOC127261803 isoform X2 [Andrographis paniculata]|uniref:uncharacterized protein LOC127261803 isoform X2 n=1 Tax=Andrographis paniculata TaxID=175694 RepID=UPI0021E85DC0|nr:uncharacterized protein LOC127261803 isoform X2 [Andrographis paniculata]